MHFKCYFDLVFYPVDADYENPSTPDIHLIANGKEFNAMIREIVCTLVANVITIILMHF